MTIKSCSKKVTKIIMDVVIKFKIPKINLEVFLKFEVNLVKI